MSDLDWGAFGSGDFVKFATIGDAVATSTATPAPSSTSTPPTDRGP